MKSIATQLRAILADALVAALGEQGRGVDPLIRASGDAKFGDYQSNVAMSLAKQVGRKPRELAETILAALAANTAFGDMCETPEIAGPGFVNLRLRRDWLNRALSGIATVPADHDDRLGIEAVAEEERETVVVDYSSPNVAKQMHVGHLRSTIIGDTIARVLEFEGHRVARQNHVGDWGTQFGIILEELRSREMLPEGGGGDVRVFDLVSDPEKLEAVYRAGNSKMSDPEFAARARQAVVRLQSGDESEMSCWRQVVTASLRGIEEMYRLLDVRLSDRDVRGESFYNPMLPGIVDELKRSLREPGRTKDAIRAVCREDQGALCVFVENATDGSPVFKGKEGEPLPLIAQKSDGAFLYASTDLAAALFRINDVQKHHIELASDELRNSLSLLRYHDQDVARGPQGLGGDRILYVVGTPQKLHFHMFFAVVKALGWTRPRGAEHEIRLEHVTFGSVLGEDRKPLKTRSGENVKLRELLDESVKQARRLVDENAAKRQADLSQAAMSDEDRQQIAEVVGIASVKYADLRQDRNSDYVFSWEKMLAMTGNTAPYLMYAFARIRSIFRKGAETAAFDEVASIRLEHSAELALGIRILQLAETLDTVSDTLYPHVLCDYLYDLAGKFMTFYEHCPVVKAPDDATRASRLRLCDLAARTLRLGLGLLGIKTLERM